MADFEARIPGHPSYLPVAVRLVQELGAMPSGPGEDEIERLVPALEKLFQRLLEALDGDGRVLEALFSPSPGTFVLRLRVGAGTAVLAADDPVTRSLDVAFDDAQVDARPDGSLEVTVSKQFSS